MFEFLNTYRKYLIFFSFILILSSGLFSVKDYGVSSDESDQRHSGFVELNYIGEKIAPNILNRYKGDRVYIDLYDENYKERFSGHILNTVSAFFEVIFKIEDRRDVFIFKHHIYFFLFFFSLISFYKICQIRFDKWYISIIGVFIIFLSPRIFANSFYDPKDIPFLSMLIFSVHFGLLFFKNRNLKHLIYFSVFNALVISGIRIYGIISPILILSSIILYTFIVKENFKKNIFLISSCLILSIIFSIILKPYLWNSTLTNFLDSFKYLGEFGEIWSIPNLFFGEIILSKDVPWYFSIVWISITTPIFYLALFLFGLSFYIVNFLRYLKKNFSNKTFYYDSIFFSLLIIPIIGSIILRESSFNSWRHLYFIYPYFVIFCLIGFENILNYIKINSLKNYFYMFFITILFFNLAWIVKNHPYQYAYFNILAGKKNLNREFDIDYHGLSYKQNLEFIIENDDRDKISIVNNSINKPQLFKYSLNEKDRERFTIDQNITKPDYIITNFFLDKMKKHKKISSDIIENEYVLFNEIEVDGNVINAVYKKK